MFAEPKLELRSVTVRYGAGSNSLTAVRSVSLSVPAASTVGLVGESGCGKSTLARAIVNLVPIVDGQVFVDGQDYTSSSRRDRAEFRHRVQMVFQDPYASLNPRLTILELLQEAAARAQEPATSRASRVRVVLDLVGLPATALGKYPHQFSGGQRQRIAIARALAVRPQLIVCDEVTSALDVSVQGSILNLLKDLQRDLDLAYLFISHDLSSVRHMSELVYVMYLGQIVEVAERDSLFEAPRHPYTRALIDSIPTFGQPHKPAPIGGDVPDPRNPPSGCPFRTRCPVGPVFDPQRTICAEVDPQFSAPTRPHRAACLFA